MLRSYSIGHIGKKIDDPGYHGYLAEQNFFLVLSCEEGLTQESGDKVLTQFIQGLIEKNIENLSQFDTAITEFIVKLNLPAHLHLAASFFHNDVLYVKTIGQGQIYFRRGRDFDLLMAGDKSASGYLQEYDMVLMTTQSIKNILGETHDIKAFVDLDAPEDIVERLESEGYDDEAVSYVLLLAEFSSQVKEETGFPVNSSENTEKESFGNVIPSPSIQNEQVHIPDPLAPSVIPQRSSFKLPSVSFGSIPIITELLKTKKWAFVAVAILFGILLWSVVFGYQRRAAAEVQKHVVTVTTQISAKLKEAEDEAYLNPERALSLIDEAKMELADLKKELGTKHASDISKIEESINATESKITKKEEKETKEFYDLALEDKTAQADSLYFEAGKVALLDTKNSKVYVLDMEKKSLDQYTSKEIADATDIAIYNGEPFFLNPQKGVYTFTSQTKDKLAIKKDAGWDELKDMEIYNGNIYLLDAGKSTIYKYLVTESGYSDIASYFAGDAPSALSKGSDMVIDSAVYVTTGDMISKYLKGAPDKFETSFPDITPTLNGVYTDQDFEQLITWDQKAGRIFVLGKDGEYVRQLASSVITKAKGMFVYKDMIYILDGKKLYSMTLD